MNVPRLSKTVRRMIAFDRDVTGRLRPVVLVDRRRKKKKQTRGLRPLERMVRTVSNANDAFAGTYARRHRRSNRKRKDGWLRDSLVNVAKAANKGRKKLKVSRILSW